MRAEAADGDAPVIGSQTVGRFLDEWLRDAVEPFKFRRTYEKRAWAVNLHIKPALGSVRLRDLDSRRIQTLYASMAREGFSYATHREIHVTLKMALGQALKWGLVRRNECEIADAPRELGLPSEVEARHLYDEQARLFFRATAGSRWNNCYVAAVRTGLRPGELLGLRWEDIDLVSVPGASGTPLMRTAKPTSTRRRPHAPEGPSPCTTRPRRLFSRSGRCSGRKTSPLDGRCLSFPPPPAPHEGGQP